MVHDFRKEELGNIGKEVSSLAEQVAALWRSVSGVL
jgi:hypothetical protein